MNSHHFANVGFMIAEKGKIKPCSLSLLDEQISKNILENMINFLKFEGQKIHTGGPRLSGQGCPKISKNPDN